MYPRERLVLPRGEWAGVEWVEGPGGLQVDLRGVAGQDSWGGREPCGSSED